MLLFLHAERRATLFTSFPYGGLTIMFECVRAIHSVGSGSFLSFRGPAHSADVIAENRTIGRGDREKKPRVLG